MPFQPDQGGFNPPTFGGTGGTGGSSGSGGSGGGGGSTTPGATQSPTRAAATGMFVVTRLTPDRVEYGPAVLIGPNDIVTVSPIPSNTVNCFYSTAGGPDAAKFGPRVVLASAGVPRIVKVRNLNEIGVYSTVVGEGVTIDVQFGER